LEDYIKVFEESKYVVSMHNPELGEMFFVLQFLKGLKVELKESVQSQVLDSVGRVIFWLEFISKCWNLVVVGVIRVVLLVNGRRRM
jgi:hypothetical protein